MDMPENMQSRPNPQHGLRELLAAHMGTDDVFLIQTAERRSVRDKHVRPFRNLVTVPLARRAALYSERHFRNHGNDRGTPKADSVLAGEFESGQTPAIICYKVCMARMVCSQLLEHDFLQFHWPQSIGVPRFSDLSCGTLVPDAVFFNFPLKDGPMSTFSLKPNHAPVKAYYATLRQFAHGRFDNEGNIRRAFEELLTKCARQLEWFLVSEYQIARTGKAPLRADAALLDAFSTSRAATGKPRTKKTISTPR